MTAPGSFPRGFRLLLPVAVFMAGCTVVEPWDRPVDGVRSVSEWISEPVETGHFPSADAALQTVRELEMGLWTVAADAVGVGFVGDEAGGSTVGYSRTILPPGEHPLRAVDLSFDMRRTAEGWWVGPMERRFHCAGEVATVDFCQ